MLFLPYDWEKFRLTLIQAGGMEVFLFTLLLIGFVSGAHEFMLFARRKKYLREHEIERVRGLMNSVACAAMTTLIVRVIWQASLILAPL